MSSTFTLEYVDENIDEDVVKEITYDGTLTDLMPKIIEQWDGVEDIDDFEIMAGFTVTNLPMDVYNEYNNDAYSSHIENLEDLEDFFDSADNCYQGSFYSNADFAENFFRSIYGDPSEELEHYIDWDSMGEDYTRDYTVVEYEGTNYYFRNK